MPFRLDVQHLRKNSCCAGDAVLQSMVAQLGELQPLLAGVTAAFHHLSLQWLTLHKGVAKLGYIVTSLLSGVIQEGYCTATEQQETEGGEITLRCLSQSQYSRSKFQLLLLHLADCSS